MYGDSTFFTGMIHTPWTNIPCPMYKDCSLQWTINVLQYLRECGCSLTAKEGHLDVLKYSYVTAAMLLEQMDMLLCSLWWLCRCSSMGY
jgi:hypothetical protein